MNQKDTEDAVRKVIRQEDARKGRRAMLIVLIGLALVVVAIAIAMTR